MSKRKKIFLAKTGLQRKYLRLVILSLILPTFIVGGCLYYLMLSMLAESIAVPEFIAYTLFPAIDKINTILLFGLPVVFLILVGTAMIISHRLTGPIERLQKETEDIVNKGDYSKRIQLRKNGDLKPIADGINKLLDKIGGSN